MQGNRGIFYYMPTYLFGLIAAISFYYQGFSLCLLAITSFGIIPILELYLNPKMGIIEKDPGFLYDILLYSIVPFHYFLLIWFLQIAQNQELNLPQSVGLIVTMGILCGVYGINVAHELGHRKATLDRIASKTLLMSSLYMHYFIEHNRGHHKNVGTPQDPASARRNESLYAFWLRCIPASTLSAFNLERERLRREKKGWFNVNNEFLRYVLLELVFLLVIYFYFGSMAMIYFLLAAFIGVLLLETTNYIEHYGIQRKKINELVYEPVNGSHSWNSDHRLGRYMLFELTRHSHHHLNSLVKYPALESIKESPQLPTGYPGMMILAMFPPLWFRVMNKRLEVG